MQRAYQAPAPSALAKAKPAKRKPIQRWMLWGLIAVAATIGLIIVTIVAVGVGIMVMVASPRILPGVSAAGIPLGNTGVETAALQLQAELAQITVRDGDRVWKIAASQLGLTIDAQATALAAQEFGRGTGSLLDALWGNAQVAPIVTVDGAAADKGIRALAQIVEQPAVNATIRMIDGQLTPLPAIVGHSLDIAATVERLRSDPGAELADGALDVVMNPVAPSVTDATALLEKTRVLLASPLTINAFDPISNQTVTWSLAPDQWGQWLTTTNTPTGIALSLDPAALVNYMNGQNATLGDARYIDVGKSAGDLQAALAAGRSSATVRIFNKPTRYSVAPGDTIGSLAWKFGMPMFHITNANRGMNMNALNVGQTINIPSKDELLPLPVVNNKRIVVSISKQHMTVYENGQVKWDWVASTGIADSPTLPGVYQIQSHEKNAYAGNWNLWMPNFMGIYDAVPGFTNGIHGMPTRNGYGILWENSLGRPVTYGCILLSSKNAELLYNWAEEGVVIEIQR